MCLYVCLHACLYVGKVYAYVYASIYKNTYFNFNFNFNYTIFNAPFLKMLFRPAHPSTSESFAAGLADFEREHCKVFRKWDADDEQDLEWTSLHGQYVGLVERRMEEYCQEQGASTETLFKELSELTDNTVVSEFLPQVLMNTDYVHFASQMKLVANNDRAKDRALSAMDEKKGFNLSGVYQSNPDFKLDKEKWGRFLEVTMMCIYHNLHYFVL